MRPARRRIYTAAAVASGLLICTIDMDVTRLALFFLVFSYSVSAFAAAEVEYIGPEKQKQLEDQWNEARFNPENDLSKLARNWSCDMYGARSRMQAQHDLKLYALKASDGAWINSGAQLVSEYRAEASALVGRKDRFEDQVKLTPDGKLVSRLSLNNAQKTVVAYSVCKTL